MRIVIPTLGTRGDVQPYIALATGLQRRGHAVTVNTHPSLGSLVRSYGVPFAPMGPDVDLGREAAAIRGRSRNLLLGFLRVMKFTFRILEQSYPDVLALCRDADLVVVSHTAAGKMEADALCLPTVSVTLFPQAVPAPDPSATLPYRALMSVAEAGMNAVMTRPLNHIRKRLGLPPMGPSGITSERLNLLPISPLVAPPNPCWKARHRVVGYWFSAEPEGWLPPAALQSFLDAGDPPVVVSLGAMSLGGSDARRTSQLVIEAVMAVGQRVVLQGWEESLGGQTLPATIFHCGAVPHGWLLDRAGAIVHHGGFGTTAAGFRAGIPAIVIPHIIDQFVWGQKVFELGVGPRPLPRSGLTVKKLAGALEQARGDTAMRERAAQLGKQIRAETGVEDAIALIESLVPPARH